MKHLYRPRLKDLSGLSRSAGKGPIKRLPQKRGGEIKFNWGKFTKIAGLGVLVLAVALSFPPQIQKIKIKREEAQREAELQKRQKIIAEIKSQANDSAQKFFNLGMEFLKKDELLKAELSFAQAIIKEPYFRDAHIYLGYTYFKDKRLQQAEREARRAIELDPTFPNSHLLLAEILKEEGRKEEAAESLERATVLGKQNLPMGGE